MVNTEGEDPEDAHYNFIEALLERGLRGWIYVVTDEVGDSFYLDGYGNVIDEDDLGEHLDRLHAALDSQQVTGLSHPATGHVGEEGHGAPPAEGETPQQQYLNTLADDEAEALKVAESLNAQASEKEVPDGPRG